MFRSALFPRAATLCATLLGCAIAGPTAHAQSWEISDEIQFAENLARAWMFDLSADYLEKVASGDLDPDGRLSILYTRAVLQKIAGENADGVEARMQFLDDATKGFADYLDKAGEDHEKYDAAQKESAQVQRALGSLFAEQLAAGDADPELKGKAESAFREAIKRLNKEFNRTRDNYEALDLSEASEEEKREKLVAAYQPMQDLANTYYEFAQLYEDGDANRADYLRKAAETAEDFLWDVGSDSFASMQAYYTAGRAYIDMGEWDEGLARLEFVIDDNTGFPSWFLGEEPAPDEWLSPITAELEKVYFAIAESANAEGKADVTLQYLDKLQGWYDTYGERGGERGPTGDLALIERAKALHSQGKPEGMQILQRIANENAQNTTGAAAASAIGELLGGGADQISLIPATVWFTAGQSAQQEGEFRDALDNFHKAIAALGTMTDPAKHKQIALDSWKAIGDLYRGERRFVEASIAYDAGLDYSGAGGELTLDEVTSLGGALFNSLQARYKETKNREDETAKDNARTMLAKRGVEQMGFLMARDDFEAARVIPDSKADERKDAFREAAKKLKDVAKKEDNYERALILLARTDGEQGDYAAAIKKIDAFFKRIADPKNEIGAIDRKKQQARDIASTEATFYKATYQNKLSQPAKVLETLEGFEESFPTQTKFYPNVNFLRLRSHLEVEPAQIAEAEALYATKSAEGTLPSEAQYFLARALLEKADAIAESDPDQAKTLRTKGAQAMYEYCKGTGFSSYSNLKVAGDNFRAIDEHEKAEGVYRRLIDTFGNNATYRERVETQVKRLLASSLLDQGKDQEAAPMFQELLAAQEQAGITDFVLMRMAAYAMGGRVDVVNGKPTEMPGAGLYVEASALWDKITTNGYAREDRYKGDWWEAKYYVIYSRWRAREIAPEWANQAKKIAKHLNSTILSLYPRDEWAETLGGEDWVKRYDYLLRKLL